MLVRNNIRKTMARIFIVATGLSLLVCVAFFDVQSRYRNVVVYDGKEGQPWNVSSRRRTLMQRTEKGDWKQITNELEKQIKQQQREMNELLDDSESLTRFFETNSDGVEDESGVRRRLPGAIIIGVKKGGTRALLEILRLHPDVVAPGPEIHFFDRHYKKGLQWYRSQMPVSVEGQLTIEKTPGYLVTPGAPQRIANMSRNLLLLVVVRDPVTRALSDYAQASSKRPQDKRTFEDMAFRNASTGLVDADWTAIRIGQYAKHLERWMRFFPLSQIHVVSGERLVEDPVQELQAVQKFLKIRPLIGPQHFFFNQSKGFPCLRKSPRSEVPRCLGKTKGRSHPQVAPASLQRLRDFFRPFNQKFYRMVGRDFQWT